VSHENLPKINRIELDDLEQARTRAEQTAGAIGGITIPVTAFRQGSRYMYAGALPVPYVVANLVADRPAGQATLAEVQAAKNRPVVQGHIDEIERYLVENVDGHFILPPLTLNVKEDLMLFTFKEPPEIARPVKAGFLVIARDTQIDIADGQHRKEGIKRAYENLSGQKRKMLADTSLAVMLTCETDPVAIHQDFADCSKTRPISPSQLAVYDRRNPANALVLGLVEQCPLFTDKLDTTSSKLGKTSPFPFITNQVRQVVKMMLTGSNAEADDVFEQKARDILGDGTSKIVQEHIDRFATYLNRATEAIPEYKEIASTPAGELKEKLSNWRNVGFVSLTGTGLVAIARVLYELMQDAEPEWHLYVDRMKDVDWRRSNPEWSSRVVTPDHQKVNTGYAASMHAASDIKRMIGWARPKDITAQQSLELTA
jgi:DNA sulfur modification protein DndB